MNDEDNEVSGALPDAAPVARREHAKTRARSGGFFDRTAQFLRDTRAEMRRVSWPSLNEVKNTTIITLVAVVFFAVYLFVVDRGWAFLLTQLDKLLNRITGAA
jgi:preprotein translocase subunit SecE